MRHRPQEPELRKVLPWLAAEKPELFNAYQQTHGERVEKAMLGAKFVASFIGARTWFRAVCRPLFDRQNEADELQAILEDTCLYRIRNL
jgi:hypothetical protein